MKKAGKLLVVLVLLFLAVSCRRSDISVNQVMAQPYMERSGRMGLALYLRTSLESTDKSFLHITDPSGDLTWTVQVNETEFDGTKYYGSSDIVMPTGLLLPTGTWTVELVYKDGRTIIENFNVNYKNADTVLEKYADVKTVVFDAESNLTIK